MIIPIGSTQPLTLGPFLDTSGQPVSAQVPDVLLYVAGGDGASPGGAAVIGESDSYGVAAYTPDPADFAEAGELLIVAGIPGSMLWFRWHQVGTLDVDLGGDLGGRVLGNTDTTFSGPGVLPVASPLERAANANTRCPYGVIVSGGVGADAGMNGTYLPAGTSDLNQSGLGPFDQGSAVFLNVGYAGIRTGFALFPGTPFWNLQIGDASLTWHGPTTNGRPPTGTYTLAGHSTLTVTAITPATANASDFTGQFPSSVLANAPTAIATQCQVQVGTIAPGRIEIHQGSAFVLPGTGSPVSISVVDQNQNPINLAGRTVELIATSPADTSTVRWRWTTAAGGGLTIVGAGSNVIQINADSTNSQTAGDFELFAWDITNGARNAIPEAHCRLSIKAAPQP